MNIRNSIKTLAITAAVAVFTFGCADPSAGVAPKAPGSLRASVSGQTHTVVVRWHHELPSDVTASQTIGPSGGTISLPSVGLTVTFAAGALSAPTTISITAQAGRLVSYDFEPHGTVFGAPVTVQQSLVGTNVKPNLLAKLVGAYLANGQNDIRPDGTATASELLPLAINKQQNSVSFVVKHFSGYILAWI